MQHINRLHPTEQPCMLQLSKPPACTETTALFPALQEVLPAIVLLAERGAQVL